jgi:hypothetical protein
VSICGTTSRVCMGFLYLVTGLGGRVGRVGRIREEWFEKGLVFMDSVIHRSWPPRQYESI